MKTKIIALLLLSIVVTGFKCGGGLPNEPGVYRGKTYENKKFTTSAGAIIGSRTSINSAFGPLVDGGIQDVNRIASAQPNNYDVSDLPASRYKVWLFPRSSRCIEAAFLVDATNSPYEGTEWDKNPAPNICWVCAAGMTIMQGQNAHSPGMLITDDMGVMRTIVRYEAEHSILFYKDHERYNATMYHTNGGHPILGEGPPVEAMQATGITQFQNLKAVTIELPIDIVAGNRIAATKGQPACVLLTK